MFAHAIVLSGQVFFGFVLGCQTLLGIVLINVGKVYAGVGLLTEMLDCSSVAGVVHRDDIHTASCVQKNGVCAMMSSSVIVV